MIARPAPRAVPPQDLRSLRRAITERAREFEIAPLLDLLASMGYRPSDVYFRGHVTESPQPTLLHRIEFADSEDENDSEDEDEDEDDSEDEDEDAADAEDGDAIDRGARRTSTGRGDAVEDAADSADDRADDELERALARLTEPSASGARSLALGSIAELAGGPSSAAAIAPRTAPPPDRRRSRSDSAWTVPGSPRTAVDGHRAPVTITINLGLLSCRSPLPSYFQYLLRDAALHEPLLELLQIIDRNLLRTRLTCDRPERVVAQWDEITRDLVRIHRLDSLIGLSWLFRHLFPELPVIVERTADQLRVPYASARLGSSALGSACLGATTQIDIHDFQITLRCEDSTMQPGVPWLHEIDRRLRSVAFPALEPVCINLTIVLEFEDDQTAAALRDERVPPGGSYLGVDPLGRTAAPRRPRRIVLYRGVMPRRPPDTDELEQALAAGAPVTLGPPTRIAQAAQAAQAAQTAAQPDRDAEDTQIYGAIYRDCAVELVLVLGDTHHRYRATLHWGVRAWFRDEPHAIALTCDRIALAVPSPQHHPQLWNLLRDHARRALAAALAASTLAYYEASAATDAIIADLLARGQDAALYALLAQRPTSELPREAWERFATAQP
jgi:hypothetical protein